MPSAGQETSLSYGPLVQQNDSMAGKMDYYGISHVGNARSTNQDQFLIADLSKSMRVHQTRLDLEPESTIFGNSQGKLLLVADGMGGHAAGEQASRLVVECVTSYVMNEMSWPHQPASEDEAGLPDELLKVAHHCQEQLLKDASLRPERTGMGTTLTLAYVLWPHLHLMHVGDSRCYLWRGRELQQLTTDHTVAQSLIDSGSTQRADVRQSVLGNMLWNVIGGQKGSLDPETSQTQLLLGDTVLLCTDGLTKHVSDELLAEILSLDLSAQDSCELLVTTANNAGGTDNITLVIVRFLDSRERVANRSEAMAVVDLEGETTIMDSPPVASESATANEDTVSDGV